MSSAADRRLRKGPGGRSAGTCGMLGPTRWAGTVVRPDSTNSAVFDRSCVETSAIGASTTATNRRPAAWRRPSILSSSTTSTRRLGRVTAPDAVNALITRWASWASTSYVAGDVNSGPGDIVTDGSGDVAILMT